METPISLYEQFKKDHPETIGEKDTAFDKSNYIDWLENQIQHHYVPREQHEEDVIEAHLQGQLFKERTGRLSPYNAIKYYTQNHKTKEG